MSTRLARLARLIGPGLVTGASDDDPSGIATYSQVGAQFGFGLLWTMLFSYPLMSAVQEISARIGRVTGHGIAGNMCRHSPVWLTWIVVGPLVVANTINVGADLAAMGAAVTLLIGGPPILFAALLAVVSLVLETFVRYARYAAILKWMTLSLFAYVATAFAVDLSWPSALRALVAPSISFDGRVVVALIAVLGTTISPYLLFWQSSQEVEELRNQHGERPLKRAPLQAPRELRRIRIDTYLGMAVSNIVAFFIILTCAATLHEHGVHDVDSAARAAAALRPVAGPFAAAIFAAGIVGTGLLAVPVLAGSAAYAVAEVCGWPTGLDRQPTRAQGFYAMLAASTLVGLALTAVRMNPMRALFWTAVINGIVAVPALAVIVWMATDRRIMGEFVLSPLLAAIGWATVIVMLLAAIGLFVTWGA